MHKGKRVVLHCGANKTGTTATQASCFGGRAHLSARGVLYPDLSSERTPARSHWPLAMSFWHEPHNYYAMKDGGYPPEAAKEYAQHIQDSFDAQVSDSKCKTVFISSEAIGQLKPDAMARFRDFLESRFDRIDALYYARDPVAASMSFLQEHLKAGHEASLRDFMKSKTMNFGEIAKRLTGCFGDRVKFRLFSPEELRHGDIISDVLYAGIGLPEVPPEMRSAFTNESLSAQASAFLFFINRKITRRGENGLDPVFVETQRFIDSFTRQNRGAAKLSYPSELWKSAVRMNTQKDWLIFLDHAGFTVKASEFRNHLKDAEGIAPPSEADFEQWMRDNFKGFPIDTVPENLKPLLDAGLKENRPLAAIT